MKLSLISSFLILFVNSILSKNDFDTYNEECPRIRRAWYSLSSEEKQQYVDALMTLRENGAGKLVLDELIAVGSVHQDDFGSIVHTASSYLFWHGYLLWELESRIRALGDEYKCFAMPYWDFSTESEREEGEEPQIFTDENGLLGGYGDPENEWTVNEYSWKYTTEQYWVPAHCRAKGDIFPICSLKRATSSAPEAAAEKQGGVIIDNPIFGDFSRAYASAFNLPHNLLTNAEYLFEPVVTSYDPIWYLFHSMVSYHQAMWTDCNDYDLIKPTELDDHPEAYSEFCDSDGCGDMSLDGKMYFGGYLTDHKWAFVNKQDLTVRKSFHFDRWNIIYDLEDGEGFYQNSGLSDYCKGKLNPDWWIISDDEQYQSSNQDEQLKDKILSNLDSSHSTTTTMLITNIVKDNQLIVSVVFVAIIIGLLLFYKYKNNKDMNGRINAKSYSFGYGSV